MPITHRLHEGIAVLTLELGQGNAINAAFIAALDGALDELSGPEVRALVVTGSGRAFCGGLDLLAADALDRPAIARFVEAFDALFLRVFSWPTPVVAAVNGHAIAGGAILAMAADVRVMASGPFGIGINEVLLGIPFPSAALEVARHALPRAAWPSAFLGGTRYSPEAAAAIGLVHHVVAPEAVVDEAIAHARALSAGGAAAVRRVKADLLAPTLERIEANRVVSQADFVEQWFAPEARARVGRLRDELLARRTKAM
jgi:enoyl-CoA hydratase